MLKQVTQRPQLYSFGKFQFDPQSGELKSEDGKRVLQQQPAEILAALLQRPAELVTRDELVHRLWPSGTFVDFDRSLNKAVNKLRDALGDSSEHPQYIETLPRRGYRFIAPVNTREPSRPTDGSFTASLQPAPAGLPSALQNNSPPGSPGNTLRRGRWRYLAIPVVVIVLLLAARPIRHRLGAFLKPTKQSEPQLVKLTDNRETERVAISPQGRYIAYTRREQGGLGLWVRQVAMRSSEVRIVAPEVIDYAGLSFSPDESEIYFVRDSQESPGVHSLYRVPILGGPAKLLLADVESPVSFSPDGKQFVFTKKGKEENSIDMCIAAADGSEEKLLARLRNVAPYHQSGAAWSPDGQTIVISVMLFEKEVRWALESISMKDGSAREFFSHPNKIGRPLWLDQGHSLLVALDDRNNNGQLYVLPFPNGQPRRITRDLADYEDDRIDLTRDGKIAAIVAWDHSGDVWQAPSSDLTKAQPLATSGVALMNIAVHRDGKIMASGLDNRLWQINAEGRERTLFTEFEPAGVPLFCGPYVLFLHQTIQGDSAGIMRAEADGTHVIKLVDAPVGWAACAPDGQSVFYDRVDVPRIENISVQGGVPTKIVDIPSSQFEEQIDISPDGNYLAYLYSESTAANRTSQKVALVPLRGNHPASVVDMPQETWIFHWSPDSKGLQFIYDIYTRDARNLWQQAIRGGKPEQLTRFTSGRIFDFTWSANGKKLLFIRGDLNGDVVLIRNPG